MKCVNYHQALIDLQHCRLLLVFVNLPCDDVACQHVARSTVRGAGRVLLMIDRKAPPGGSPDDAVPSGALWQGLARLRAAVQDRLWARDEKWAADCGYVARRSRWGWSIEIHNPAFDRRHPCGLCNATGRQRITGAECSDCAGTGVVTEPERPEAG